jgi:hypothetical protein
MKKLISIFGISILLFAPGIIAINIDLSEKSINLIDNSYNHSIIENNPPGWANAECNGTWGVSISGEPAKELGWLEGYMNTMKPFGGIECELPSWENNPNVYLNGIIISYFILGLVIINNNTTFYIGFGNLNEDGEFYYNIHLFIGPSWYIEGTWREINIK